jgi:predicted ArsR family transcriptional regulator
MQSENRYPARPGYKTGDTSAQAAQKIAPKAETLREAVFLILRKQCLTADEVAARLGESVLSIRPRLSELAAQNLIEWTGERRKNASGMSARVWAALR